MKSKQLLNTLIYLDGKRYNRFFGLSRKKQDAKLKSA